MVLVDTNIWSLALRRRVSNQLQEISELNRLIETGRICMIGVIRQELLSGIRNQVHFDLVKQELSHFPDQSILTTDYVEAARLFNTCRSNGIQGSLSDFLICAVSLRLQTPIFTLDKDFSSYGLHCPISLHQIG